MGVGAGLYMYVVVVQKFTFAISSPDEFLFKMAAVRHLGLSYEHVWTTHEDYSAVFITVQHVVGIDAV